MDDHGSGFIRLCISWLDFGYDTTRLCATSQVSKMFDAEEPASTSFRCLLPLGYALDTSSYCKPVGCCKPMMVEDAYMCDKYLATSSSILQPFIGNQVGCSQIRDSEDMRVPESAEPTFVLRTWDVCTRGVLCAKLFAEVFANVTIMVLKHFWDPMTEISGVTCPHWKVKECAHGGTVKNAPLWSSFCCSLIEGWQGRQKSGRTGLLWAACIKST